ncbi:murein biosynthesis integral membrane protein MurJ [Microvirga sp. W0021]|uniref:Probable lipid II flippase MurJ n=1 Tax=Hohaiivirga grylli TaxID=3133970 RepID=A0ABV0BFJ8_9HYPH
MSPTRATLIVSLCAALSRILGFVRDILLTQFLGAGVAADAFLAAFRLPNALRRIASEGGFNPAFIPLYIKLKAESPEKANLFARQSCILWGFLLVLVTAIAALAAPLFMRILAGGLQGETFDLSVFYFRLIFPLVFGSSLAAILAAILNAEKKVVATSLAPLICNLTVVIAVIASQLSHLNPARSGSWIALAAGFSGLLHLMIMILTIRDSGLMSSNPLWRITSILHSKKLRHFLKSAVPILAAVSTIQLLPIVAAQVASHTPSAVSWYYYADRLFQLPVGFIAAAAGIVLLPQLARQHARNDKSASLHTQNRALENALFFAIPAAAALAYLASPIIRVLFQRGVFEASDSLETSAMLFYLSLSLPFAVITKILTSSVFAIGKLKAAFLSGLTSLIATFIAAKFCVVWLGAAGIAIGASFGMFCYFVALATTLHISGLWQPDRRLYLKTISFFGATALMLTGLFLLEQWITPHKAYGLAILCFAGLGIYIFAAWLFRAFSITNVRELLQHEGNNT